MLKTLLVVVLFMFSCSGPAVASTEFSLHRNSIKNPGLTDHPSGGINAHLQKRRSLLFSALYEALILSISLICWLPL